MPYPLLIRLPIAASALALIFFFAACDRTDRAPVAQPEKVSIAFAALPETALAQIAHVNGHFRNAGLETTAHVHTFGKLALKEVLEGKADFATVAETPIMLAIMNGEKISIIATIQSSTKNHCIIARKDRGIHVPQDLKGKKIATTLGITSDYFLDSFLALRGIPRNEVIIIDLKPEEHQKALANGEVDAISTFNPYLTRTQNALGVNGIPFRDENIFTGTFHIVATQEFIRKNPGKITKMLTALVNAVEFSKQNPGDAQKIVADFIRLDKSSVEKLWADHTFDLTLSQSLILSLEDESRWAIKSRLTKATRVPNYLDYVYLDGLRSVKPEAVRILR